MNSLACQLLTQAHRNWKPTLNPIERIRLAGHTCKGVVVEQSCTCNWMVCSQSSLSIFDNQAFVMFSTFFYTVLSLLQALHRKIAQSNPSNAPLPNSLGSTVNWTQPENVRNKSDSEKPLLA